MSESAGDFGEVWDTLAKYGKLLGGGLADWTVRGLYTDANGLPA